MTNSLQLSKIKLSDDLSSDKVFDQILFASTLIKDSGSKSDLYHWVQDLEHLIFQKASQLGELKPKYDSLLLGLRLEVLSLLADKELEEILSSKVRIAFENQIDLSQELSLSFIPFFSQEDFTKLDRMIRYFEGNAETVGKNNIALATGKIMAPLVSNWLKDYKTRFPENKGSLNLVSYISQSPNCKKLEGQELDFLKFILSFYDWLRFKASKTSFISEQESASISKIPETSENQYFKPVTTPSHGADLEVLRRRMQVANEGKIDMDAVVKSDSREQITDNNEQQTANSKQITQQEIEREVKTKELPPPPKVVPAPPPPPPVQKAEPPKPIEKPIKLEEPVLRVRKNPTYGALMLDNLGNIKRIDDLKKVSIENLRQGLLEAQIQLIKAKIITLSNKNKSLPYFAVAAFEQSPLFATYLLHGTSRIENSRDESDLTQEEFEAIADLKKEIERL